MGEISADALRSAAARVSSQAPTSARGSGGLKDPNVQWEALRGKTARAIVAVPDLAYYWTYLCTNRTSAKVRDTLLVLDELIPLVEGLRLEQKAVEAPQAAMKSVAHLGAHDLTDVRLEAIGARVDRYIAEELVPAVKAGSRAQKRGPEARTAYGTAKAALTKKWKILYRMLEACSRTISVDPNLLQNEAAKIPLASLQQTLSMAPPPEEMTAYTIQLAASMAAVRAMAKSVSVEWRVRIYEGSTFPAGLSYTAAYEDGFMASITFSTQCAVLGIRSGDKVVFGSKTATVTTVGGYDVALMASEIPETPTGLFEIYPAARDAWRELQREVRAISDGLATSSALISSLQRKEGPSAAETRDTIVYLCEVYAILGELSSAAQSPLTRVGGEVDDSNALLPKLDAYSPFFSQKVRKLGDSLLAELDREGYDAAKDLLLRGRVTQFLLLNAAGASKKSALTRVMFELAHAGEGD